MREQGHSATLAGNPWWAEKVREAGVDFLPAGPRQTPDMLFSHPEVFSRKRIGLDSLVALMERGIGPALEAMAETLLEAAPGYDALVAHHFVFAAQVPAEVAGMPWASVSLAPSVVPSRYGLPAAFGCRASKTFLGQILNQMSWSVGRRLAASVVDPWVNRMRARHGLPPQRDAMFTGVSPVLNLQLYSRHFAAKPPDWGAGRPVCGFSFYDGPGSYDAPEELKCFLAAGAKPWLFTLGSTLVTDPREFYSMAVEAVRGTERRAVLLTGYPRNRPPELPPNVMAIDSAPYSWIMPRCSVVAHQGGIGTSAQAMRAGLPMLVVPRAFDQPNNGARLAELGIAQVLRADRLSARRIYQAMESLAGDARTHAAARQIASGIAEEDGPGTALRHLAALVNNNAAS